MRTPIIPSEVLTVMFIDIVGYTSTTARLTREEFSALHDLFDNIALPIFKVHGGKVIKKIGDAFLVTFKSPTNAVICGKELQNAFESYSKHSQKPLRIRVAIHTGEILIKHGDIYGDAVNTAARIETIARPGDIVLSEQTYSAMNQNEVEVINLGQKQFKGLKHPIRLFRVKSSWDEVLRRRRLIKQFITRTILIILLALAVFFILTYAFPQVSEFLGI